MKHDKKTHTAYNEAGHTVANYYFSTLLKSVTIIPDNKGYNGLTTPEKEKEIARIKMLMIHLAGPAAEKMCLGELGPGADGDIINARNCAQTDTEYSKYENKIIAILKQPKYRYAVEKIKLLKMHSRISWKKRVSNRPKKMTK